MSNLERNPLLTLGKSKATAETEDPWSGDPGIGGV